MTLQWFLHVYRSYKVPFRRVWWWFRFYLNARVIASSICTQRASMYKDSLPCIRRMDGFSHTTYIDCECRLGPRQNLVDPHRVMLPCMRVLCMTNFRREVKWLMALRAVVRCAWEVAVLSNWFYPGYRVVVILYYGVKTEIYKESAGINQSSPKSNRFFPFTIQTIPENLVQIRSPVL